ncbi:hypothetical protein CGSMWGv00703Bmash_04560 [Gardnerella pickettii 00703Bmash]|nr:hypothetical protein CGSMWGv00703Bmash_04560 [Gardnerella pickettii 00703Bmash]
MAIFNFDCFVFDFSGDNSACDDSGDDSARINLTIFGITPFLPK